MCGGIVEASKNSPNFWCQCRWYLLTISFFEWNFKIFVAKAKNHLMKCNPSPIILQVPLMGFFLESGPLLK